MSKKLLRKKLALMLANLKKKRPFYCELEYLENTGTSSTRNWISTGIVPDNTTKWEVRISFNNTTTGKLMGSGYATGNRFNIGIESNKFRFAFNGWFDANSNITTPDTNVHTWIMDAPSNTFTIDGYSTTTSQSFGTSIYPIGLFGRCNRASGITESSNAVVGKIYYSKIWKDGVLVSDMIPVLDWDYVPCMYDKVSGQLFYNKGTGTFTYGREIHYVEYLESTGTQYADLGIYGNLNTEIEVKAYVDEHTTHFALVGDFTDSTRAITLPVNYVTSGLYSRFGNKYIASGLGSPKGTYKFVINKTGYYRDDVLLGSFNTTTSFTTSNTLMICGFKNLGRNYFEGKIYYCKVRDNGTLVGDFLPAIDENGVGFIFDKVSHTIYDNAGTGAFKYPAREVEYLGSDGTQYINTGYIPKQNTYVELNAMYTALDSTYRTPFSERAYDGAANSFTIAGSASTGNVYAFGSQYWSEANGCPTPSLNIKHFMSLKAGVAIFNGVTGNAGNNITPTTLTAYMFARNTNGTASNFFKGRIYNCLVKEGTSVISDFVPCYKDGVAGMLDKANNVFYTNAGTGTFTTGKIVESEYE